jgi:hypothetical protein
VPQQLVGRFLQAHHPRLAPLQLGAQLPEVLVLGFDRFPVGCQIHGFRHPDPLLGLLEPDAHLGDDRVELLVLQKTGSSTRTTLGGVSYVHEGRLEEGFPAGGALAHRLPPLVVRVQPGPQLVGSFRVFGVVRQVRAYDVQRSDDALVAVQVQEELAVVLDHVFELFDVGGRRTLSLLGAFSNLQPLLEPPEVVVQLGPVALGAQRTKQTSGFAVEKIKQSTPTLERSLETYWLHESL